jgi:hypothetical protein
MNVHSLKGRQHLLASPGLEITQVIEGSKCLWEVYEL